MAIVNITHRIHHILQHDENYCWACAFAMVLGRSTWQQALDLAERVPVRLRNSNTGAVREPAAAALSLGLSAQPAFPFGPNRIATALRRGPVAVFGCYNTGRGNFDHVMVLSGLNGDTENPASLTVAVDDPLARGMTWTGTWDRWYGPTRILRRADRIVCR